MISNFLLSTIYHFPYRRKGNNQPVAYTPEDDVVPACSQSEGTRQGVHIGHVDREAHTQGASPNSTVLKYNRNVDISDCTLNRNQKCCIDRNGKSD